MTFNRNLLSEAVRYGLAAGAVGLFSMASAPAFAQTTDQTKTTDQTPAPATELDRITVTGSRIPRVEVEGPTPITVLTRKDLEVKGDLSVADVLRSSTFNSFGSFREASGNTAQSQAVISLRGVGSNRTLILLDGRRMASSPVLDGAAQNLNAIPFAAVERIEILRDGASAIYGSDAIGGVINIILRKDYEGLTVAMGIERPTAGEPAANSGSITGGVSGDRGNMTFVIDHQDRDIFFNGDRNNGVTGGSFPLNPGIGLSAFGFPPTAILYDSATGAFNGIRPDPRCPTALGSDPLFPDSVRVGSFCRFNYAATSANAASLRRDSLLVNGNFQLSDNISAFARVTTLTSSSFGRYAPAPITSPFPTMAGDNPNNIFPGNDLLLFYRFVPGGFRDNVTRDHMMDILFGLEGQLDWFGGTNWELAAHHSRYEIDSVGTGYALAQPLQALIDSGALNPFGDPRDPAQQAAVAAVRHTVLQNSGTRYFGVDGQINFDLFEMANGPVGFAAGFDYKDESLFDLVDAQSAAGNVQGTAGGNTRGERASYAIFAETSIPLLSNLNLSIAGRLDHYNDFGSDFNPKFSVEYRPLHNLLLRASYSTGFRAPTLGDLYRSPLQTFTSAIDTLQCNAGNTDLPFDPCSANQYEASIRANPNLSAEKSTNWGAGVVWNPLDNLSFSLDYYNIQLADQISTVSIQTAIDRDAAGTPVPGVIIERNAIGAITFVVLPAFNLGGFRTAGFDFEADYKMESAWGTFNPALTVSYVDKFETRVFNDDPWGSALGFAAPDTRANLTLQWNKGDLGAAVIADYIGDSQSVIANNNVRFPAVTYWSVQGTYNTPWNGKVTVGVRNLNDKQPPLSSFVPHPYYLQSQYDAIGRTPYLRYEQKF